jgi:hypothetical protein
MTALRARALMPLKARDATSSHAVAVRSCPPAMLQRQLQPQFRGHIPDTRTVCCSYKGRMWCLRSGNWDDCREGSRLLHRRKRRRSLSSLGFVWHTSPQRTARPAAAVVMARSDMRTVCRLYENGMWCCPRSAPGAAGQFGNRHARTLQLRKCAAACALGTFPLRPGHRSAAAGPAAGYRDERPGHALPLLRTVLQPQCSAYCYVGHRVLLAPSAHHAAAAGHAARPRHAVCVLPVRRQDTRGSAIVCNFDSFCNRIRSTTAGGSGDGVSFCNAISRNASWFLAWLLGAASLLTRRSLLSCRRSPDSRTW